MAWVIPALQIAAQVGDTVASKNAQDKANRYNVMLQREQQAWETKMSNTAVQRRVDDIKAAGGNPATAFYNGGSASTPSVTPAHVEPNFKGSGLSGAIGTAALMKAQIDQARAATANTEAQTAKTQAETTLLSADLPFSAANARARADALQETVRKFAAEIGNLNIQAGTLESERDLRETLSHQEEKLAPLRIEAQKLLNETARLGQQLTKQQFLNLLWDTYGKQLDSAEKRASYNFWEKVPQSKFIQILRQLAGK